MKKIKNSFAYPRMKQFLVAVFDPDVFNFMFRLIFYICEGRPQDIKVLEGGWGSLPHREHIKCYEGFYDV